jgi:ankyrin repeat protein
LGADIHARNRLGETALFVAVKKNDLATAQKLMSLGLSVYDKNSSAQNPMTFVHNKTSKYLFDYTYKDSLFVAAVKHRNLDQAKSYLQLGANINYVSKYTGCAAIHYAVENNDVSSLKFLKSKGANMMLPYKGMAPVEKALMGQKKESLQFLLANDVGSATRVFANGKTLMHRALSMQNGAMWMNVLLSHGAKVDAMDNAGETPLAYAIQRNRTDLVAFLIKKNANVNRVDAYGNRPLHIAARYANGRIVKMLVDAGADPSVENNEGDKPVNVAENVGNESAQDELDNYSFFGKARKSLKSVKNAGAKLWDKVKDLAS